MAWFVVQKDGERARMVTSGELMGAIYCTRAEVRVTGFATYEKAQAAVDVVDTKLGIRLRKADVKRAAAALAAAAQAHQSAPTAQTLEAVKTASAVHEAECAELRALDCALRIAQRELIQIARK